MKRLSLPLVALALCMPLAAQNVGFTNFIRQVQLPTGVQWDASVAPDGERASSLPVDIGGARFELWTVRSTPAASYLLDTRFVSAYAPAAEISITSEDPYQLIPRTRADRPFTVNISLNGLLTGSADPAAAKAVSLLRHVQSYGVKGSGEGIDRTQATLLTQSELSQNGARRLTYSLTSVPSADRTQARGEERFSVFSLPDGSVPASQLASRYIQIWPVATGSIGGITPGSKLRVRMPQLTFTLNDLYPSSHTFAQIYKGDPVLGTQGTLISGSSLVLNEPAAVDRVLLLSGYDTVVTGDGRWTIELLTTTPFGTDRLAHVTFDVDRTIELRGTFTTIE